MKILEVLKGWRMERHARKAREAIKRDDWSKKITPKVLDYMRKSGALLIMMLFVTSARAEIDLNIIAQIESSNNPLADSFAGAKYGRGLYQISEVCLKEYVERKGLICINPKSLYNPVLNKQIAEWYLKDRIPQMLRWYKKPITDNNILWAYNAGIGMVIKGIMPEETRKYIIKYHKAELRKGE